MKKKIIILCALFVCITYKSNNVSAQWATYDVGLNPMLSTATSTMNTTLSQQLTNLVDANKTLLTTQGYTQAHLKIVQEYALYLKMPNADLMAVGALTGKYSGVYKSYAAVMSTVSNIGFLSNLISFDGGSIANVGSMATVAADVALFMSAVRSEATNIIAKVTDIKTVNKFQMTDGERINLLQTYDKQMQVLLGAAQTYVIRAQRVVIGMKSAAKDDNQMFNNL